MKSNGGHKDNGTGQKPNLRKMLLNPYTLSFPKRHERTFRDKYFADSLWQFRLAFFLVALLYAAFGFLDTIIVPEYREEFFFIRFAVVIPVLTSVIILSYFSFFRKVWQLLLFFSFILGGVGIIIIEKSGERMLNIINDIVDISRIEAGLMDVTLKESNINEQLDYIYTFFKPQVKAKGMQFRPPGLLPDEKAIVVTDREKLFAILTNLVKNAIKYSNEGTIEFGCGENGSALKFFVRDTGIGIPKDRQHAIFDRFVQADIEDRDASQGAGLGLAICKAYVEMLGGEIWVESEKGKGSSFYFTIPFVVKSE